MNLSVQQIGAFSVAYFPLLVAFSLFLESKKDAKGMLLMKIHSALIFVAVAILMTVYYFQNTAQLQLQNMDAANLVQAVDNNSYLQTQYSQLLADFQQLQSQITSLLQELETQNTLYNSETNATQNKVSTLIALLNRNASNLLSQIQNTQLDTQNANALIEQITNLQSQLQTINSLATPSTTYNNLSFFATYQQVLNCIRNIYNMNLNAYEAGTSGNNNIDYLPYQIYNMNGGVQQENNWFVDKNQAIDFSRTVDILFSKQCNNFLIRQPFVIGNSTIEESQYFPYSDYSLNIYPNKFIINADTYNISYDNKGLCFNNNIFIFPTLIFNNSLESLIHYDTDGNIYSITSNGVQQVTTNIQSIFAYEIDSSWLTENCQCFMSAFTIGPSSSVSMRYNGGFQTFNISNNPSTNLNTFSNIDISPICDNQQNNTCIALFFQEQDFHLIILVNTTNDMFIIQQYDSTNAAPVFNYNNA